MIDIDDLSYYDDDDNAWQGAQETEIQQALYNIARRKKQIKEQLSKKEVEDE